MTKHLHRNASKSDSPFPELISRRLRRVIEEDLAPCARARQQYKVAVRPHNDISYNCIKKQVV